MSEPIPGASDGDVENDVIDLDQAFGDENVDAMVDTSYVPPDHMPHNTEYGTTQAEESAGETIEQRLAQEEPDVCAGLDQAADAARVDPDHVPLDELEPEELRYAEVGVCAPVAWSAPTKAPALTWTRTS